MLALATVVRKSFDGKFTVKIDFPIGYFYIVIADTDIGSLKSCHTLFDKYLDHMLRLVKFEQNHKVLTKFWASWQKMVNHFWQCVDTIVDAMFLWLKQLFDDRLLIQRLISFSVLKIMVVRNV